MNLAEYLIINFICLTIWIYQFYNLIIVDYSEYVYCLLFKEDLFLKEPLYIYISCSREIYFSPESYSLVHTIIINPRLSMKDATGSTLVYRSITEPCSRYSMVSISSSAHDIRWRVCRVVLTILDGEHVEQCLRCSMVNISSSISSLI